MPDALGECLPEELVHAVLVRLDDREYSTDRASKRGLASCSLTCRHWAKVIRPILFGCLTISSAEDVSQLSAFLSAPDFLDCPIRDCIRSPDLVEDQTSPGISWGHQFFLRLHEQLHFVNYVNWIVKGTLPDDQAQPASKLPSLPFALLPKALPMYTMRLEHVTLSNLQLPSTRSLISFVKHLRIRVLGLDNIVFPEGSPSLRRVLQTSSSSRNRWYSHHHIFQNCISKPQSFPFWFELSNTLFAGQRCPPLLCDDIAQTIAKVFALSHQCKDVIPTLDAICESSPLVTGESTYVYRYCKPQTNILLAGIRIACDGSRPRIIEVFFSCAHTGDIDISSLFAQLEAALINTNGPDALALTIECQAGEAGRILIDGILEDRILAQLRTRPTMLFAKISEISGQSKSITVEQILSAPTSISSGEETIPLTTAQRTEWVLDKYIRKEAVRPQELLHAARETGDIAGTSSATGQRAVKRSEDDAAGQAQGVAADQDEEQRDRGEE